MESQEFIMLMDVVKGIRQEMIELQTKLEEKPKYTYRSEQINELALALSKAQAEFEVADLNRQNPYFKSTYADYMSVVMASRPALCKYQLSVVQQLIDHENGEKMLHTILMHGSQFIESRMRIVPPKNDIQSISSTVTYCKRMAYSALIGVVTGDDDDGEAAVATSRETFAKGVALNTKYNAREESSEVVNKHQLEELQYELSEYPDIAESVLEGLRIQSIADIPASKYSASIKRIREIKNLRNNGSK